MKQKPYELNLIPISSSKFTATQKEEGVALSTFASDLGAMREGLWWLQRLYNDACDVGIALQNETGEIVRYLLHKEEKRDGDIIAWHFVPLHTKEAGKVTKVTIWND